MRRRINPNINFISTNLLRKFRQSWKMLDAVGDWIERNADKKLGYIVRFNANSLHKWTESVIDTQFSPNTKRRYVYIDLPKQEATFLAELHTFIETLQDISVEMDMPDMTEKMLNASHSIVDQLGRAAFEHSGN